MSISALLSAADTSPSTQFATSLPALAAEARATVASKYAASSRLAVSVAAS